MKVATDLAAVGGGEHNNDTMYLLWNKLGHVWYLLLKLFDFVGILPGFQLLSFDFRGQLSVLLGQRHNFGGGHFPPLAQTKEWMSCEEAAAIPTPFLTLQIPARISLSSSLFLFRCLISKSFSLTSLKRRLFSSLSSLSWSCKCSFSKLQQKKKD